MNVIRPLVATTLLTAALTAWGAPSADAVAPACTSADLHVSYHPLGAAAGSLYGAMRYRNVTGHSCRTGGYGGLSFVGHGDGTQIGAAAVRAPGTPVPSFVLRPGQRAVSRVQIARTANYDPATCRPTRVDGFRVYVPNSRVAQFVAYRTTACASTTIVRFGAQLSHQALRKVG